MDSWMGDLCRRPGRAGPIRFAGQVHAKAGLIMNERSIRTA